MQAIENPGQAERRQCLRTHSPPEACGVRSELELHPRGWRDPTAAEPPIAPPPLPPGSSSLFPCARVLKRGNLRVVAVARRIRASGDRCTSEAKISYNLGRVCVRDFFPRDANIRESCVEKFVENACRELRVCVNARQWWTAGERRRRRRKKERVRARAGKANSHRGTALRSYTSCRCLVFYNIGRVVLHRVVRPVRGQDSHQASLAFLRAHLLLSSNPNAFFLPFPCPFVSPSLFLSVSCSSAILLAATSPFLPTGTTEPRPVPVARASKPPCRSVSLFANLFARRDAFFLPFRSFLRSFAGPSPPTTFGCLASSGRGSERQRERGTKRKREREWEGNLQRRVDRVTRVSSRKMRIRSEETPDEGWYSRNLVIRIGKIENVVVGSNSLVQRA